MNVFMDLEHFPKLYSKVVNLLLTSVVRFAKYVSGHLGELSGICRVSHSKMFKQMVSFQIGKFKFTNHGMKVTG